MKEVEHEYQEPEQAWSRQCQAKQKVVKTGVLTLVQQLQLRAYRLSRWQYSEAMQH